MLDKRLASSEGQVLRMPTRGSEMSRFPLRGAAKALDHMLVSPRARDVFLKPRVLRHISLSDHRPLGTRLRSITAPQVGTPVPRTWYDSKLMASRSDDLANHNRWLALADAQIDTTAQLSQAVEDLAGTFDSVTRHIGVKLDGGSDRKLFIPQKLRNLLKKYKKHSRRIAGLMGRGEPVPDSLTDAYVNARAKFRKQRKEFERREKQKSYARIADDFLIHDHKNVWSRLRAQIDTKVRGNTSQPVRNKAGFLCVDEATILAATRDHFKELAQDDREFMSRDEARWVPVLPCESDKPEIEALNKELTWPEALVAIRGMNRNTAPGKCGMHVNALKALVSEECMAKLERDNPSFVRPDRVRVDLKKEDLPADPLTPMGRALWKVLLAIWALETIPALWNEVHIVSLFKKGDPELLTNYRGISLISVSLKVLLGIMVDRLSEAADAHHLLPESQSGFRKREEAIAQFLMLTEVVRRRHLLKAPTIGIFVDFKKAYDKVCHGALYRVLHSQGVQGKFLNIVKAMYSTSAMAVRTGGRLSEPFEMHRGTRQGCPLSPLLFILFMAKILADTKPEDSRLTVPRVRVKDVDRNVLQKCEGGLYADDLVCLERNVREARERCINLQKWGEKWGMELGLDKCGVMLWSIDPEVKAEFDSTTFDTAVGIVPKVAEYKYLGIMVTPYLGVFMGKDPSLPVPGGRTDAMNHALAQAAKGLRALGTLKPLLLDKYCPVPLKVELVRSLVYPVMTYGGEFIGFNKRHSAPMQRVIDMAMRWILGLRRTNRQVAGLTLSLDLGLPPMYEVLAGLRARLHAKLETPDFMKTLLPILQQDRASFHPYRTWCTENGLWTSSLLVKNNLPATVDGALPEVALTSGLRKWAPWLVVNTPAHDETVADLDEEGYDIAKAEWLVWVLHGQEGPPPVHKAAWMFTQVGEDKGSSLPLRPWLSFARQCELHRRSNRYYSLELRQTSHLELGIDQLGFMLLNPEGVPRAVLNTFEDALLAGVTVDDYIKAFEGLEVGWFTNSDRNPMAERLSQVLHVNGKHSGDAYRYITTRVRNVRECALERLLDSDGRKSVTFSNWYNRYRFGATRDFLRVSLGRPDLTEGVRWLMLTRAGGFPRVASRRFARRAVEVSVSSFDKCPLCLGDIADQWEWAHLALCCTEIRIRNIRRQSLGPAITYLRRPGLTALFYDKELGKGVFADKSRLRLEGDEMDSGYAAAVAIQLLGGSLTDEFEASYTLSFGQCDMIITGLKYYGFAYMAEFLQRVAPLYCLALGLDGYGVPPSPVLTGRDVASSRSSSVDTVRAGSLELGADEAEVLRELELDLNTPPNLDAP